MNGKLALFCCLLCVAAAEVRPKGEQPAVLIAEGKGAGTTEVWINGEPAFFANGNFRSTVSDFPLKSGINALHQSGPGDYSISLLNAISGDAVAISPSGQFSIYGRSVFSERDFSPLGRNNDAGPFLLAISSKINRALTIGDRAAFAQIFEGDPQITSTVFPPGVYRERQWLHRSSIEPDAMRVVFGAYFAMVMPDTSKLKTDQAWLVRLDSGDFRLEPKSYLFARNLNGKWIFYPNGVLYGTNPSAFIIKQMLVSGGTP
ncbi:hypothetical protein ESB00_11370 [Oleiharenicola lentus]|uniref:Uncharacterized protein n=1 Tax=Oleiharenicola lentus TaxID=2508720 RepID=A0A4Q1CBF2_9BACT|nr:hypothetical protein [Oleiharenicola lentus]RXK56433.1 hypothetical protein ESB00_11370 [Oleiharenicola lentus]